MLKSLSCIAALMLGFALVPAANAQDDGEAQAQIATYQQAVSQNPALAGADQQWRFMYFAYKASAKCEIASPLVKQALFAGFMTSREGLWNSNALPLNVSREIEKMLEESVAKYDCDTLNTNANVQNTLVGAAMIRDSYLLMWNVFVESASPSTYTCGFRTMPEIAAGKPVFAAGAERLKQLPDYAQREANAKRFAANVARACGPGSVDRFSQDTMLSIADGFLRVALANPTVTE